MGRLLSWWELSLVSVAVWQGREELCEEFLRLLPVVVDVASASVSCGLQMLSLFARNSFRCVFVPVVQLDGIVIASRAIFHSDSTVPSMRVDAA